MNVQVRLMLVTLALMAGWDDAVSGEQPPSAPQWIWIEPSRDVTPHTEATSWHFERELTVERAVQRAVLRVAADDCRAEIKINGRSALRLEPFSPTTDAEITTFLKAGANQVEIVAQATGPAPAIAARLILETGAKESVELITDGRWQIAERGSVKSLGMAAPELWGLSRRPATIDPFDNYEQWRQALGDAGKASAPVFWTAPGFEITQLRTATADEGSWVSMAFDPQGRLTIAREEKGLLRMTLANDRQSVAGVETINDTLLECRGLLYAHGALYANANNSKGLYRLRDANGDGQFEEVRLLREFPGGVGHGRNDLALGPDGSIYSIHGDSVDVPTAEIIDRTSPFREARRGHKTSEGYLLRTDLEGKSWELVCGGMRNPFGIAFNSAGDPFTYDADAEFDMGAPWYRPTRVLQLRSGADFGWRGVTGKWPPYFPDHADNALPALDIGKGSPTAVAFGTGSQFPPPYRDALFILDWAYGRVLAVHLAPRGAGYRASAETFLKGRPLNVTDLTFGPDGAMYLITGGRKTQSALYRVAYVGPPVAPAEPSQHERDCRDQVAAMKNLLGTLESLHHPGPADAIETAWPHLDSADPVIRHAARIAIEHQPIDEWRGRALAEPRTTASLAALLALARSGEKDTFPPILQRLVALRPAELQVSQMLAVLHIYDLALAESPDAVKPLAPRIIGQLTPAFAPQQPACLEVSPVGTSIQVQRRLADLLVKLGSRDAVEQTARSLLQSDQQEDRLQALFALRQATDGWTPESRRAYFTALQEGQQFLGGDGMPRFLLQIREQAVLALSEADKAALADVIAPPAAATDESELQLPDRPAVKAWTIDDFAEQLADPNRKSDPKRGETVYREALCIRCHRVGLRGPAVGPDLTHVAGRFSRRDMLESILTPHRVVAENYRNVQVQLLDGRVLTGRVLSEGDYRSEKLRLSPDPLRPGQVVEIDKREIDRYQVAETSPMPTGLLDRFNASEVLDLLAYLSSGPVQPK
jgi:putative heme-binding domain-containing protein